MGTISITVPLGVLVLTVAIDVHKNRLEMLWTGWGKREESWLIDHIILPGEVQDDAVWTQLGTELKREFDHALGCKIGLRLGLVDGGKWPDWVYKFFRRLAGTAAYQGDPLPGSPIRGKVRACRGRGGPAPKFGVWPVVDYRFNRHLAGNLGGHWIGTDAAKDLIYTRARLEPSSIAPTNPATRKLRDGEPCSAGCAAHISHPCESCGRIGARGHPQFLKSIQYPDGYIHISNRFDEEFVRQLFAEKVTVKYEGGKEIRTFQNKQGVRNEALDLAVYNLAAFRLLRLNEARLDLIEAELKKSAEDAKPGKRSKPRQREESDPAPGVRGRGWNL